MNDNALYKNKGIYIWRFWKCLFACLTEAVFFLISLHILIAIIEVFKIILNIKIKHSLWKTQDNKMFIQSLQSECNDSVWPTCPYSYVFAYLRAHCLCRHHTSSPFSMRLWRVGDMLLKSLSRNGKLKVRYAKNVQLLFVNKILTWPLLVGGFKTARSHATCQWHYHISNHIHKTCTIFENISI